MCVCLDDSCAMGAAVCVRELNSLLRIIDAIEPTVATEFTLLPLDIKEALARHILLNHLVQGAENARVFLGYHPSQWLCGFCPSKPRPERLLFSDPTSTFRLSLKG
jgi:hypothetical protein